MTYVESVVFDKELGGAHENRLGIAYRTVTCAVFRVLLVCAEQVDMKIGVCVACGIVGPGGRCVGIGDRCVAQRLIYCGVSSLFFVELKGAIVLSAWHRLRIGRLHILGRRLRLGLGSAFLTRTTLRVVEFALLGEFFVYTIFR